MGAKRKVIEILHVNSIVLCKHHKKNGVIQIKVNIKNNSNGNIKSFGKSDKSRK